MYLDPVIPSEYSLIISSIFFPICVVHFLSMTSCRGFKVKAYKEQELPECSVNCWVSASSTSVITCCWTLDRTRWTVSSRYAENCRSSSCLCFCSEGDGGGDSVVAYYQSEFDVHVSQQASLDEAITSLEPPAGSQPSRHGRILLKPTDALSVNSVVSRGLTPQPPQN